jgi:hypothetical protein
MRIRFLALAATGSLLTIGAGAAHAEWFSRGLFTQTDGRVGYHMYSQGVYYDSDVPPECGHNAENSYELAAAVEGALPPGLTYDDGKAAFEGTPRQPGDWTVTVVSSHIHCRGSDIDFGDRRRLVHFHINP